MFEAILYKPLGAFLAAINDVVGSYGLALIIFTVIIKLLLLPLSIKQQHSSAKMAALAPKQKEIQNKFKHDKQRQNEELTKLYQQEGVNPAGGCLPLLIQFPIIIALYSIISRPLSYMYRLTAEQIISAGATLGIEVTEKTLRANELGVASGIWNNLSLFPEYANLTPIDFNFLGINLAATPDIKSLSILWVIPILAAITSYLSIVITNRINPAMQSAEGTAATMNNTMKFTMPAMSLWLTFTLPCGIGVYWTVSSAFAILQQYILNLLVPVKKTEPVAARKKEK